MLDEDAERFAEAFGMEEGFEGEAGADVFFFGGSIECASEGGGVATGDGEEEVGLQRRGRRGGVRCERRRGRER